MALLLLLPVSAQAQDFGPDTTRAYNTFGMSNELTDNRALMEYGVTVGRLHRFGDGGAWNARAELGAGFVDTFEGRKLYGSLMLWGGRSWSQSLVRVSDRFRARPSVIVGGGLYRFDGGRAIPGDPWAPTVAAGLGVDVVGPPQPGSRHGVVSTLHIVREERLADGLERDRWFMRVGFGIGTSPDRLLPERVPEPWWEREAPDIPLGPDRAGRPPRPELPHHVYGYWAEERVPGLPQSPDRVAPDLAGADSLVFDPDHRGAVMGGERTHAPLQAARTRLRRNPDDAYAMHELGAQLALRDRHAEALRAFSHALEATGSGAQRSVVLSDMGTAWAALGWADSAMVVWRAAMTESRHTPAPAINAGVLLEELGRPEAALEWYRAAADRAPGLPIAWENLAYALTRMARGGEAVEPLTRALTLREGDRGIALVRWACHDRALYRELTGKEWQERAGCDHAGRVPSPALLPPR